MKLTPLPPDAVQLLRDRVLAGVYVADEDTARAMFQAGPTSGFNVYRIDLSQARTQNDLHRILGKALHFPDWYGANWDALSDSLTDMSWNEADGYLIILQRADILISHVPEVHNTLLEVLREAVIAWQEQGVAFWVLFVGDHPDLPKIGVST